MTPRSPRGWMIAALLLVGATTEHCSFRGTASSGPAASSNRRPDSTESVPNWSSLPRPTPEELQQDGVLEGEVSREQDTSWTRDDDADGLPEATHVVEGDTRELREYTQDRLRFLHRSRSRRTIYEWLDENTDGNPERVSETTFSADGERESTTILIDSDSNGSAEERFVKFRRAGQWFRRNDRRAADGGWLEGEARSADYTYRGSMNCGSAAVSPGSGDCGVPVPIVRPAPERDSSTAPQ